MFKRNKFLKADRNILSLKIKEVFSSVFPITLIVLLLSFTICPIDSGTFLAFITGVLLVVIGLGVFTMGADIAMTPIGEYIGTNVVKTKKLWIILPIFFIVGVFLTISEPDLQVLGQQLAETINMWVLIIAVGVGVGVFLVIAFLRVVLKIKLKFVLILFYVIAFVLSFFVPKCFVPLAFDSGGVTTGPMSVPFLIAIGTGVASIRSDNGASDDSFGLTALCSIGPIVAVMILGIIYQPQEIVTSSEQIVTITNSKGLLATFFNMLPEYMKEVAIALLPILLVFYLMLIFGKKISKHQIIRISIGAIYAYVGLVLFLVGVNLGFLPVGKELGDRIGHMDNKWIIVPLGMVIGFFVVAAEPAVHVLTEQVFEITSGSIPKKALRYSLMIGVMLSVGLAMLRILLQIDIMYILIPTYLISLILTFFTPDIFTAVAFDSGGVASGAMTAGFLMPLALGLNGAVQGDSAFGFGVVAFVAMTPLITIQILGVIYKIKLKKAKNKAKQDGNKVEQIIE